MTAKIVIASAKRLIEFRQSWRSSSRMAEINVPAWPMPIHQTKLMMSMPQPTGTFGPQMPMPRKSRFVMVSSSPIKRTKPTPKPEVPEARRRLREHDGADLVGDRREVVPRLDERDVTQRAAIGGAHALGFSRLGLGFRTCARYVVRGRVLSSVSSP